MRSYGPLKRTSMAARRLIGQRIRSLLQKKTENQSLYPKVLANSIPKAGTNLLNRLFYFMPGFSRIGFRTLRPAIHSDDQIIRALGSIGSAEYRIAHLEASEMVSNELVKHNVKSVLIIRDPRNILISHLHYVTSIDRTHRTHKFFANLKNDVERIESLLAGMPGIVNPLEETLKGYFGWMDNQSTYVVKFEDLIGFKGGGSEQVQYDQILSIIEFLGLPIAETQILELKDKIFSESVPTFRQANKDWRTGLSRSVIKRINNRLEPWAEKYGYLS